MQLICDHCGSVWTISKKKYSKKNIKKSLEIAICPYCGRKNFYSIIRKYVEG